mmetsp:Transcript_7031/g.9753  ORF Transcript_7031/g.9753 Transcript_7031/m.9753 type:complete len:1327 (+) Transcript_7031:109-4089(+)|eukprot:CAMPEP_0184478160 /NCGR_PEP_ID=MMETSP0113_2-20130426/262_1 /TAXON_ID=91329 /ORGANISM="Norrisiella sphaerica, Strain BC52" /LENGTH=1326 /DNA_ID=CAMNT_0026855849 /DNA_START=48 /DNA_END=4028 /DNA_ORIENTATION=+
MDGEESLKLVETGGPEELGPIYRRFDKLLGTGAYKDVFLAYNTEDGIDVAWNTVKLARVPRSERERIEHETNVLRKISHKNIIKFFDVWRNDVKKEVCFTTEIVQGGSLKSFINRVYPVQLRVMKRWCKQILEALEYLHGNTPPIIHRDLKCENIFINNKDSTLVIGDFGLAAIRNQTCARSVLGTPHFMAPELYDENYTEKVDIYAFGMCVLEMATNETPYTECINAAQIFKKVYSGQPPGVLKRIKTRRVREFIEICLLPVEKRLSAKELLRHPFLQARPTDCEEMEVEAREEEKSNSNPYIESRGKQRKRSPKRPKSRKVRKSTKEIRSQQNKSQKMSATYAKKAIRFDDEQRSSTGDAKSKVTRIKASFDEEKRSSSESSRNRDTSKEARNSKGTHKEKPTVKPIEMKHTLISACAKLVSSTDEEAKIAFDIKFTGAGEEAVTNQKIVFDYNYSNDTVESVCEEFVGVFDLQIAALTPLIEEVQKVLTASIAVDKDSSDPDEPGTKSVLKTPSLEKAGAGEQLEERSLPMTRSNTAPAGHGEECNIRDDPRSLTPPPKDKPKDKIVNQTGGATIRTSNQSPDNSGVPGQILTPMNDADRAGFFPFDTYPAAHNIPTPKSPIGGLALPVKKHVSYSPPRIQKTGITGSRTPSGGIDTENDTEDEIEINDEHDLQKREAEVTKKFEQKLAQVTKILSLQHEEKLKKLKSKWQARNGRRHVKTDSSLSGMSVATLPVTREMCLMPGRNERAQSQGNLFNKRAVSHPEINKLPEVLEDDGNSVGASSAGAIVESTAHPSFDLPRLQMERKSSLGADTAPPVLVSDPAFLDAQNHPGSRIFENKSEDLKIGISTPPIECAAISDPLPGPAEFTFPFNAVMDDLSSNHVSPPNPSSHRTSPVFFQKPKLIEFNFEDDPMEILTAQSQRPTPKKPCLLDLSPDSKLEKKRIVNDIKTDGEIDFSSKLTNGTNSYPVELPSSEPQSSKSNLAWDDGISKEPKSESHTKRDASLQESLRSDRSASCSTFQDSSLFPRNSVEHAKKQDSGPCSTQTATVSKQPANVKVSNNVKFAKSTNLKSNKFTSMPAAMRMPRSVTSRLVPNTHFTQAIRPVSPNILAKAARILSFSPADLTSVLGDPNRINLQRLKLKHKFKDRESKIVVIEKAASVLQLESDRRRGVLKIRHEATSKRRARTPSPPSETHSSSSRWLEPSPAMEALLQKNVQQEIRPRSRSQGVIVEGEDKESKSGQLNDLQRREAEAKRKREADVAEAKLLSWLDESLVPSSPSDITGTESRLPMRSGRVTLDEEPIVMQEPFRKPLGFSKSRSCR